MMENVSVPLIRITAMAPTPGAVAAATIVSFQPDNLLIMLQRYPQHFLLRINGSSYFFYPILFLIGYFVDVISFYQADITFIHYIYQIFKA